MDILGMLSAIDHFGQPTVTKKDKETASNAERIQKAMDHATNNGSSISQIVSNQSSAADKEYQKDGYSKSMNNMLNKNTTMQYESDGTTAGTKAQQARAAGNREEWGEKLLPHTVAGAQKHEQHIYEETTTADKQQFLDAARKSGMTEKDAEKEIKDIDKKTSIDANDKQAFGHNQGGKYDILNKGNSPTELQFAASNLYNDERDDKSRVDTNDKQNAQTDNKINSKLGLNNDKQSTKNDAKKTTKSKENPYSDQNIQAIEKQANLSNNALGKVIAVEAIKHQQGEKNGKPYQDSNQQANQFFNDAQKAHKQDLKDGNATQRDTQINQMIVDSQSVLKDNTNVKSQSLPQGSQLNNQNGQSTHRTLTKYSKDNKQLINDQQAQIAKDKTNQAHNEATNIEK